MRVLHLSKIVIGAMALALSSSLLANNNINTSPSNTSNQQQINKFKKDSYAQRQGRRMPSFRDSFREPPPRQENTKITPAPASSSTNNKQVEDEMF